MSGPACCVGGCCGPGSYCCGHPDNPHTHDEEGDVLTPQEIRDRLENAGITYPANWDDMGSSEKDLWEDRQIARLNKKED